MIIHEENNCNVERTLRERVKMLKKKTEESQMGSSLSLQVGGEMNCCGSDKGKTSVDV